MFSRLLGRGKSEPARKSIPAMTRLLTMTDGTVTTPDDYRRSFETEIVRYLRVNQAVDDEAVANMFAASTAAYAAASYRAAKVASLPLYVLGPDKTPLEGSTPFDWFLRKSAFLLENVTLSLLIWGRAYLRKLPNPYGWPTGLEWINPLLVTEQYGGINELLYYDVQRPDMSREQVMPDQMVYLQMFDTDPYGIGLSKFEVALRNIGIELGLATYSAAFFVNNARIDGMVTIPDQLDDTALAKIEENWRQFRSAKNAHRTAIMPEGTTYTPIQSSPKDLMMGELDDRAARRICVVMEVDPGLLGLAPTADALSAGATFNSKEVAHIRDVAITFTRSRILEALNEQWAWVDFDKADHYTLAVNDLAHPALAEANLLKSETAIALTDAALFTFTEARQMLGYQDADGHYFLRKPAEAMAAFQQGTITLNEMRRMALGDDATLGAAGEVVLIAGQLVPVDRLREFADAAVDQAKTFSPFGASPLLAASATDPDSSSDIDPERDDETDDNTSIWVGLSLSNHPDLIGAQQAVKNLCGAIPVSWSLPGDFHITLAYAPRGTIEQAALVSAALQALTVPAFDLKVGSLRAFDTPEGYALHFRIRESAPLRTLQTAVYQALLGAGLALSSYSKPDAYTPHVTMGYATEKPPQRTWTSKYALAIDAAALVANHGDTAIYPPDPVASSPAPVDIASETVDETVDLTRSDETTLTICLPFPDHAYVQAAQRTLANWLATAWGVTAVTWTPAGQWALPVAEAAAVTPAVMARLIRELAFGDTQRLDLMSAGYTRVGADLYLTVPVDETLADLCASITLEIEALAGVAVSAPVGTALLHLGTLLDADPVDMDIQDVPDAAYPLVGTAIELRWNAQPKHAWTLRGLSAGQRRELERWQTVARKDVARAADGFTTDVLPLPVRMFVKLALSAEVTPDTDAPSLDEVFGQARAMLRSYRETRAAYIGQVETLLRQAVTAAISRQAFSSRLRSTLTRYGTQTVIDAFEDGGVEIESFDADTLTLFRAWEREQAMYVKGIADEIYKEAGGLTAEGVSQRAVLWGNKSLDDLYYTMLRQAQPALLLTWIRDPQAESCDDCLERDRVMLTIDEWGQIGFPRDRRLACGGWRCACGLRDAQGNWYRAFRDEPQPDYSALDALGHEHDVGHDDTEGVKW